MSQGAAAGRVHTFLVLKEPAKRDRVIVWDTQDVSIGRTPENDIALAHGELSRRHALLVRRGNACAIKNLSTSNGTQVNGETIREHALHPGDEIELAAIRIEFHQGTRNPATLGARLEYASQLKDFGRSVAGSANPESTVLGLADPLAAAQEDDDFEVRPAADFAYDLHGIEELGPAPKTRDLDLEIQAPSIEDLEVSVREESWTLDEEPVAPPPSPAPKSRLPAPPPRAPRAPARGTLSLHLEIDGLDGELGRRLEGLLGKTLQLPALRIRIKGDDLG